MLDNTLGTIKKVIPSKVFGFFQPAYHRALALAGAIAYRYPSREMHVIAVTGTKGKSTTVELVNAILEKAGYKTALTNTIRFKIGDDSRPNMYKMSMPGRMFMQRFLRRAADADCQFAVIEITSQGSSLYRHKHIDIDTFVFTNISPEHIEAHGSFEAYVEAKLDIARSLENSRKSMRTIIVNSDDDMADRFLEVDADRKITYSTKDAEPYEINDNGINLTYESRPIKSHLRGMFNLSNIMAAICTARSLDVSMSTIVDALEGIRDIPGRVEKIEAGQDFEVIVDYAHTTDSLEKLYSAFPHSRKICVLGGTGGGRDTWKRKEMGAIADKHCTEIILTNEDPYDEDPIKIINDVNEGIAPGKANIIIDRREAIRTAISHAKTGDAVLISGKGTDPYIMGPNGTKIPWSDADIAKEEILHFLATK